MRLDHTPPAGAGRVQHTTKTDQLLKIIDGLGNDKYGNPVGIRSPELAAISGIPAKSITALLAIAVARGRVVACKITRPGHQTQNEYRKGGGLPPPDFKPLNTKRTGIAIGQPAHRGGTATAPALSTPRCDADPIAPSSPTKQPQPAVGTSTSAAGDPDTPPVEPTVAASPATPAPNTRAELKEEPAAQKAPAGNELDITLDITLDDKGTLTIATCEGVIELDPKNTRRLGHFMVGSQGIWNLRRTGLA